MRAIAARAKSWEWFLLLGPLALLTGCQSAMRPATPQPHFARLPTGRVYYESTGQGQPVVVFIHGWCCDHTVWQAQVEAVAPHHRVLALDLPGLGHSDQPGTACSPELLARSVVAVLDDAHVSRAVLVGHSMGFPIAREVARRYPGRAQALVNIDGLLIKLPTEPEARAKWQQETAAFMAHFRAPDWREYTADFLDSMFVEQTPPALREQIRTKMLSAPQEMAASLMEGWADLQIWREDRLDLPVLSIYAVMASASDDWEQYQRTLFPQLEYHAWGDAGHFLMMEHPQRFNDVLLSFLARVPKPW